MKIILNVPSGISERTKGNVPEFVYSLRDEWNGFNGPDFIEGLELIGRRDLLENAKNVTWLSSKSDQGTDSHVTQFVKLFLNEMLLEDWKFIVQGQLSIKADQNLDNLTAFNICIDNGVIDPTLVYWCEIMELIRRNDLIMRVQQFKPEFQIMKETELRNKLNKAMKKIKNDERTF